MMINLKINPSPAVLAEFGDVPLPIEWGLGHLSVESGVVLTGTGLTPDSDGRMLLRPGSVLVPDTDPGEYRVATDDEDIAGDGDTVEPAARVLILKQWADLSGGKGLVGAYYAGGFIAERLPSLANNAVLGLEADAKAALIARGFVFGEDFGPAKAS